MIKDVYIVYVDSEEGQTPIDCIHSITQTEQEAIECVKELKQDEYMNPQYFKWHLDWKGL
ncbi:hypothetical protein KAR91_63110 [Candidatus Pacearchaeota archaeon]|nr:hypothetical protein [Candidatus Pacearchaeota archaeon]